MSGRPWDWTSHDGVTYHTICRIYQPDGKSTGSDPFVIVGREDEGPWCTFNWRPVLEWPGWTVEWASPEDEARYGKSSVSA